MFGSNGHLSAAPALGTSDTSSSGSGSSSHGKVGMLGKVWVVGADRAAPYTEVSVRASRFGVFATR